MEHPFDPDGELPLRDGPDLRDMSQINVPALVRDMSAASVVIVVYPDDAYTILKGEATIQNVDTVILIIQVANDTQAEMVSGALMVINEGRMTPERAQVLREMLTSVQNVRGRPN